MIEAWLPVVGYEGYYEVSDLGRVYRLKAAGSRLPGLCNLRSDGCYGYLRVSLCRDGKDILKRVHKVVTEAFLGPCPAGQQVLHGPGGRRDNSLANLRYGTYAENLTDAVRDGTRGKGDLAQYRKLTEAVVMECRFRYAAGGITYRELADEHDVTLQAMWNAVAPAGRTWRHLP